MAQQVQSGTNTLSVRRVGQWNKVPREVVESAL